MKKFEIELMDGSAQRWTVEEYLNIGSDTSCQMQINMAEIDARHCRVEKRGEDLILKDLRSRSGTFVNGARIMEAQLKDGDMLSIGFADFVIHDHSKATQEFPLKSKSEFWQHTLSSLGSVSQSDYSVLLLGPSGTGKDVIAKSIHECSLRSSEPFMSVNCSALTETLVESELFGHVKGSFTGAISDRKGAFEAARGGTLFLDEIGDLPYSLQAKLLRALENEEIRPVGSDRVVKTNVRVIAATHQNLLQKIREGTFRSDLFYRLNVITVEVPSLQERMEDFEELLYSFARENRVGFSYQAVCALKKPPWPGNIRELKNFVARAATLLPKTCINEVHVDNL